MTTIKLKHPITADGVELKEITLRRPKVRDLEKIDKVEGPIAKAVALIADLAEITPDQVRELDAADFTAIEGEVSDFLS